MRISARKNAVTYGWIINHQKDQKTLRQAHRQNDEQNDKSTEARKTNRLRRLPETRRSLFGLNRYEAAQCVLRSSSDARIASGHQRQTSPGCGMRPWSFRSEEPEEETACVAQASSRHQACAVNAIASRGQVKGQAVSPAVPTRHVRI